MKYITKGRTLILFFCLMIFTDLILFVSIDRIDVKLDKMNYISDEWEKEITKNAENSIYFEGDKKVYRIVLTHKLTDDMKGKNLTFKTNDSFVDAFIGDTPLDTSNSKQIYHFGNKYSYCDSPGTIYHFVEVPETDAEYITFRMETAYKNKFLTNYDMAVGGKNELIIDYLHNELSMSIPNVIMIIFGILLLAISVTAKFNNISYTETLALGCLSIAFAIYASCPLYLCQHIVRHAAIQYYMYYLVYFFLPLLMLVYFENIVPDMTVNVMFYLCSGIAAVLSILHFTGIAAYTRTINIFNAGVAVTAIVLIVMVARRFKKIAFINRVSILTLLSFCLINIIFYVFVSTLGNHSYIARAGFIIYLIFACFDGIRKIMENIYRQRENGLLEQIAYTDNLTELGNRYSLERVVKNNDIEKLSIVSMDLNYLKFTNDTFGHAGGDVLLKSAAVALKSVFEYVYRVGGDEFIALVYDADEEKLDYLNLQLNEKIAEMNIRRTEFAEFAGKDQFRLSIAAGHASYEKGDTSYEQIMQRADKIMYVKKRELHNKNN